VSYPGVHRAKYPRQDSNLRSWLRRPVLYPLSYGGATLARQTVLYPRFCRFRHLSQGQGPWQCLAWGVSHPSPATAATGPNTCIQWMRASPGPPALLPWSPHLRVCRCRRTPSPFRRAFTLTARTGRPAGLLSVAAVVTRPHGRRAPACCFAGPTCVWQSGSSSGASASGGLLPALSRCSAEGET
jgi:hypothetical protein